MSHSDDIHFPGWLSMRCNFACHVTLPNRIQKPLFPKGLSVVIALDAVFVEMNLSGTIALFSQVPESFKIPSSH